MLTWLAANIGTILIVLALVLIVAGIVFKLRNDRKKGACSCGGNCSHCQMCGSCHSRSDG